MEQWVDTHIDGLYLKKNNFKITRNPLSCPMLWILSLDRSSLAVITPAGS